MNIKDWQAQFAQATSEMDKQRTAKSVGFNFDFKRAYPVKFTSAKLIKSPRDEVQLQLEVSVQSDAGEDASEIGKCRQWVTIPYQKSDFTLDPVTVAKRHSGRKIDLQRLLSAADPHTYALYSRRVPKVTKGFDYYDFEDKLMDYDAFAARKRQVNDAVEEAAERLHEGEMDSDVPELVGAAMFLVKKPGSQPGGRGFTQFFIDAPEEYPLATSAEESVPY